MHGRLCLLADSEVLTAKLTDGNGVDFLPPPVGIVSDKQPCGLLQRAACGGRTGRRGAGGSGQRAWRLRAIRNSPVDYFSEATAEQQIEVEESLKCSLRLGADGMTNGKAGVSTTLDVYLSEACYRQAEVQ